MSALMQWNEDALVRPMSDDGTTPKEDCWQRSVRFLAGAGVTDAGGNWVLTVEDAVCEQVGLVSAVSFVATATFNPMVDSPGGSTDSLPRPSYVMTAHTHSGGHVTLYVRSFDCRCQQLADVPFDYHLAIAYDFVTDRSASAGS